MAIRPWITVLVALAAAVAPSATSAGWKLEKSESRDLAPSIKFVQKIVGHTGNGTRREVLTLVFFKEGAGTFRVVDQGPDESKPAHSGLAEAMKKKGCIAGTNGGFFQKNFAPLGLQIADGKRTGNFTSGSSLLSGVIYVKASESPQLVRRGEFKDSKEITQLLQSGPFLVDSGKAITTLDKVKTANRTFVLKGADGWWALGRTTRITLAEAGAILAAPGVISETKVEHALNLDGGSSTAIWARGAEAGGADHYKRSWAVVRNFIGIVPVK